MLVRDWMSTDVITLDVADTMQHAINVFMEHRPPMMPVLEDGKLVGVITDRDLRRASPSDVTVLDMQHILYNLARLEVGAIMTRYPSTISIQATTDEAADLLMTKRISSAPVLDDQGNILGIISKNDLFKAMIMLTGLRHRGVQFGFILDDKPGSIKEVTDIIRSHGARLVSILSTHEKAPENSRFVYVRAFNIDREDMPNLMKELGAKAKLLYMVDHKEERREIYT